MACASELRLHLVRLLDVIIARLPERGATVATSAYVTMPRVTASLGGAVLIGPCARSCPDK